MKYILIFLTLPFLIQSQSNVDIGVPLDYEMQLIQREIAAVYNPKTTNFTGNKYFLILSLILPYLFHGFYNFLEWPESMWVILALVFSSLYLHRDLKNKQKMKKREKEIKKI